MARYFRNLNNGYAGGISYPAYAVVNDTPEPSSGPFDTPKYPYGYVNMYHTPSRITPNFDSDGKPMRKNPTELFTHTPAELHVNLMYADKRVRPHMMTLMALAKLDHPDAQVMSPDTLSPFSSKLAKNAHKRGLLKPSYDNPQMETDDDPRDPDPFVRQANTLQTIKDLRLNGGGHEMTRAEVMKGKQFLKDTLRPKKEEVKPAPKVDQPQLPGMEDK